MAANNLNVPKSKSDYYSFLLGNYSVDISSVGSDFILKNGHVQYLLLQNKAAPVVKVSALINDLFVRTGFTTVTLESIKSKIRRSNTDLSTLLKLVSRNWHLIDCHLKNVFMNPSSLKRPLETPPSQDPKRQKLSLQNDKENINIEVEVTPPAPAPEKSETTLIMPVMSTRSSRCNSCSFHKQSFVNFINNLKDKLRSTRKAFRKLKKNFNYKRTNQKLQRKNKLIVQYRDEKKRFKKKNTALVLENGKLKDNIISIFSDKKRLRQKEDIIQNLKEKNCRLQEALLRASKEINELTEQLALKEAEQSTETLCQQRTYDAAFRKCIYACLQFQVPVEKAGQLVRSILKELTENRLARVPAPSTVAQMAYEMGIISNLQVAEVLFNAPPELVATLSWDATTIEGCHFNEINISLGGKTYTIEIGQLEGGATLDYFRHIRRVIKNLATTFSTSTGIQQHLVLYKFRTLINTTLTDRAPVNSCVSDQLSQLFCKELIKLNCNLHPLDGLATEARKRLKNFDVTHKINSGIFGQEGKAANLVHAISKLRYKMGSGDPSIFKSFLRMSNLKIGLIARYVGNRLHILFHSAGIIVHLKDMLLMFLKKYYKDNPFRLSLIKDLEQPLIITQLRVLGLFGKLLTGPWMTLVYKNIDRLTHMDLEPPIRLCVGRLKEIALYPGFLLSWTTDCFDRALNTDDHVLRALRGVVLDEVFIEVAKLLAEGFSTVLERQLDSYLNGKLSIVNDELRQLTSSAPLHNMHSERALGMFDSQCHRARNATAGYKDGKVKFALNKTMTWLESKPEPQQKSMIAYARKFATKKRQQLKIIEKKILEAAQQRLKLMAQRRDDKERAKLAKAVKDGNQDCFVTLSPENKFLCDLILAESQTLVGRGLHHIWADGTEDKVFQGVVSKIQGSNIFILYSSETKPTKLSIYELVTDIIMGDASFIA